METCDSVNEHLVNVQQLEFVQNMVVVDSSKGFGKVEEKILARFIQLVEEVHTCNCCTGILQGAKLVGVDLVAD